MDGADVADSLWRAKTVRDTALQGVLVSILCSDAEGRERGVAAASAPVNILHGTVYFIFRLPEMLLLADTIGCHEVSLVAYTCTGINYCL